MRAAVHAPVNAQAVASDNAASRMHNNGVANGVALGVQWPQNSQRTEVLALGHYGACCAVALARLDAEIQTR